MPTSRPELRLHVPDAGAEVAWMRYGRLPNGAPPGCLVDVAIHRERPPRGVDAGWCEDAACWVSLRLVDPLADDGARKSREGPPSGYFRDVPSRSGA